MSSKRKTKPRNFEAARRIDELYAAILQVWLRHHGLPTYDERINGHKVNLSAGLRGGRSIGDRPQQGVR